jgi:sugar-specific transcriptional regulator TrmB
MHHRWYSYLKSLGLSDSESSIYLTALQNGPQTIQTLARLTAYSRVTIYEHVDSLMNRGLISTVEKGKKRFFAAEPPERVISFAENQVSQLQSTLKEMVSSIQELKLIQSGDKPVVKMFEWKDAAKTIRDDVLNTNPSILYEFGNIDAVVDFIGDRKSFVDYYNELEKRKIKRKLIFLSKEKEPVRRGGFEEIISIKNEDDFFGDIFVYGNKISLITMKGEQIVVVVESKILSDTFVRFFELLWNQLKRPGESK